jgi:hypothetical protein
VEVLAARLELGVDEEPDVAGIGVGIGVDGSEGGIAWSSPLRAEPFSLCPYPT